MPSLLLQGNPDQYLKLWNAYPDIFEQKDFFMLLETAAVNSLDLLCEVLQSSLTKEFFA
jgi:hypothetical protein